MTTKTTEIVAYTNNGILLCLNCVERFDLTNPENRDPEDEFLPVSPVLLKSNEKLYGRELLCNSPVCQQPISAK
jgi:hypothetical protein